MTNTTTCATCKNAQEKVIQDADRLRRLHIPAGAIWLDRPYGTGDRGWGNMDFDPSFPDPAKDDSRSARSRNVPHSVDCKSLLESALHGRVGEGVFV